MLQVYLEVSENAKRVINKNVGYMLGLLLSSCEGLSYNQRSYEIIRIKT